jgi:hypothetical protein
VGGGKWGGSYFNDGYDKNFSGKNWIYMVSTIKAILTMEISKNFSGGKWNIG